jgi:predicted MPP superfamily phosphohydrolase
MVDNIKKIFHISDIHIRRYYSNVEYYIVFNNLYIYLNNQKDKLGLNEGLIVITGDVLHAKDNLTPDCVIKCYKFLKTLSEIMPVILIAGNHDMVESNKHIKDSLDSILTEITHLTVVAIEHIDHQQSHWLCTQCRSP